MCGRFALKNPTKELQAYYQTTNTVEYAARYNIAPSLPVITIHGTPEKQRLMEPMRWGLVPSWAKDPAIGNKMINARGETVDEKPSYRASFKRKRCIIPASGFFEWHTQTREPYYFSPKEGFFSFAGLWDKWTSPDGSELLSCTIITTEGNQTLKPIHDRMPVILNKEALEAWLSDTLEVSLLKSYLKPYDDSLIQSWPVDKKVNNPANNYQELLERN